MKKTLALVATALVSAATVTSSAAAEVVEAGPTRTVVSADRVFGAAFDFADPTTGPDGGTVLVYEVDGATHVAMTLCEADACTRVDDAAGPIGATSSVLSVQATVPGVGEVDLALGYTDLFVSNPCSRSARQRAPRSSSAWREPAGEEHCG